MAAFTTHRGRPAGQKQRISADFLFALAEDFEKHGAEVIRRVRVENPVAYMKIASDMVPKELEVTRKLDDLTDEQLDAAIEAVSAILAAQAAAGEGAAVIEGQAVALPALPEAG